MSVRDRSISWVLDQLSHEVGFRVFRGVIEDREVTLEVLDEPLETVLAILLYGLPYGVDYAVSEQGGNRVFAVRVGSFGPLRRQFGGAQPRAGEDGENGLSGVRRPRGEAGQQLSAQRVQRFMEQAAAIQEDPAKRDAARRIVANLLRSRTEAGLKRFAVRDALANRREAERSARSSADPSGESITPD